MHALLNQLEEARSEAKKNGFTLEDEAAIEKLEGEIRELESNAAWKQASNTLAVSNLRLVILIARKYHGSTMEDRIQAGNEGLLQAVQMFDYRKGFRFSTYASWWIRHHIMRHIQNHGRNVRIPVHRSDHSAVVKKCEDQLWQKLARKPTMEEIHKELFRRVEMLEMEPEDADAAANIQDQKPFVRHKNGSATRLKEAKRTAKTTQRIEDLLNLTKPEMSLNQTIGDDGKHDFLELLTYGQQSPFEGPDENIIKQQQKDFIARVLACLTPREKMVIERYVYNDNGEVLQNIGDSIGLTRERIRQIKVTALHKMRTYCKRMRLAEPTFEELV
jgi:RNA polymerase primary sigma factor